MNARPPDGSDEPEAADQVMLAVLSNRGRDATLLSADQERLLDDWMAGRLAPDEAERAAALVRQNALAAERVLERRLQAAASDSPPVPQHLTAQILKASAPPKASAVAAWWRALGSRWQWTSIAGAAALASVLVVAGMPVLQQMMSSGGGPLQVAMVTINDRGPLFEASDLRMRGTTPPPGPVAGERFRDVEISSRLLKDLLAAAPSPSANLTREIAAHLPTSPEASGTPVQIVVDAALQNKLADSNDLVRMPVRIYDLKDARAADIRRAIGILPDAGRAYLLTVKP